jgi:hypothetical protein
VKNKIPSLGKGVNQMPHLEGWAIIWSQRGRGHVLTADSVTGHPDMRDGSPITETSTLEDINLVQGYALTANTNYSLGTPRESLVATAVRAI